MSYRTVISVALVGAVVVFCSVLFFGVPSIIAQQEMTKKDFLAFFADEQGNEFGGVISRTLEEEQVVWLGGPEPGRATITLYRVSEEKFLDALVYPEKKDQSSYGEAKLRPFALKKSQLEKVVSFEEDVHLNGERTKITLPIQHSGVFYVEGKMGNFQGEMLLVTSNIVAQAKDEGGNLVIWTVDSRTGEHMSDGEVIGYELLKKKKEFGRSSIDTLGIARIPRGEVGDVALIRSGGEVAFIPLNYASHIEQPVSYGWWGGRFSPYKSAARSYSFTDRMTYQPGDTVFFKSLLRRDDDALYSLPEGLARVRVWTGWGEEETVLYEKNMTISSGGSIDGSFVIPTDAKTGYYSYSVTYNNLEQTTGRYFYRSPDASFVVEQYRKPEFGIDIETSTDRLVVGDSAHFDVRGAYFSGEPLRGKRLQYRVFSGTYYDWDYQYEEEDSAYRYGGWQGPMVSEGNITLDENGYVAVTVETKAHPQSLSQVYTLEVTSQDEEENQIYESRNVLVLPADYSLYRKDYHYGGRVGSEQEVHFQTVANNPGVNLGRSFDVSVHYEHWIEEKAENMSSPYPQYKKIESDLDSINFTTNERGEGTMRYTPTNPGSYRFTILGKDDRGNTVRREVWTWVSDQKGWFYDSNEGNTRLVSVKTDKEFYSPGDDMVVSIASPLTDRDVWLSIERAGVRRYQIVSLEGNTAKVTLRIEDGDMPNMFVAATLVASTEIATSEVEVTVSTESKKLTVELRPDKEKYQPGETVSLEVTGKDNLGKPVSGEVAVWAIDKALFELMDQAPPDVFKTFWSKRYNSTTSAHSLEGVLFSLDLAERGGCFLGDTLVLMEDGSSKSIESVRVGDKVRTRISKEDATLTSAAVVHVHKMETDGYLVINRSLRVTPEHRLFVNGGWMVAGNIQVGDTLVDADGRTMPVESIEFKREKSTVYNLTIEQRHTYFAGGVWAHNDKGDTRSVFKDTAYWNPRVRLGADGKARVTFRLPDNTTTWVISGVAAAGAAQFGQTKQEISVSKNVIVTESLPELMRVGDTVQIKVQVRNNSTEALDFTVEGIFPKGVSIDGDKRSVSIDSGKSETVQFAFSPDEENEKARFFVRASARGKDSAFSDAIEQWVPIREKGFSQKFFEAKDGPADFLITLPPGTNKERSKIELSLASSLLGTLPAAMRELLDYPYGCVEQTTSRFVPLVIARKEKGIFSKALVGKDTQAMIKVGVKRLQELQGDDGGWGFWHRDASNPYITSYVIEYLIEARNLGIEQDKITMLLARARTYVEQASQHAIEARKLKQKAISSQIEPQNEFIPLVTLAYTKSLLGMPVEKNEVQEGDLIPNLDFLSPELLALAIQTNIRMSETDYTKNGVRALMDKSKTNELGWRYWDGGKIDYYASRDAATARALRALIQAKYDRSELIPIVRSLASTRKAGYWSNTFATAQVVQALVDFSRQNEEKSQSYQYMVQLDGSVIATGLMASPLQTTDISITMDKVRTEGSHLKISYSREGELYSSLIQRIYRTADDFQGEDRGMRLKRTYENISEPGAEPALGDTVRVRLTASGVDVLRDRLVIEDKLPAGMIPVHQSFENERGTNRQAGDVWWWDGQIEQYTEDGVIMSTLTYENGDYSSSYLARVVNAGEYLLPPARAELMYHPEIYASTPSGRMTLPQESAVPLRIAAQEKNLPAPKYMFADISILPKILFGGGVLSGLFVVLLFYWRGGKMSW